MRGISWLAAKPVSFSRRTLLHGVSKSVTLYMHTYFEITIRSKQFVLIRVRCDCERLKSETQPLRRTASDTLFGPVSSRSTIGPSRLIRYTKLQIGLQLAFVQEATTDGWNTQHNSKGPPNITVSFINDFRQNKINLLLMESQFLFRSFLSFSCFSLSLSLSLLLFCVSHFLYRLRFFLSSYFCSFLYLSSCKFCGFQARFLSWGAYSRIQLYFWFNPYAVLLTNTPRYF